MGIDFKALIGGALWILGLAIVLAAFSWAYYEAKKFCIHVRKALAQPSLLRAIYIGLALFCFGLATISQSKLERTLWFILAIAWIAQSAWNHRRKGKT